MLKKKSVLYIFQSFFNNSQNMLTWTKKSIRKRKEHWISVEDVKLCLLHGEKVKSLPKHTDQTATWLSSYNNIRVRYVMSAEEKIIIDLYKLANCNHIWKVDEHVHNKGKGKYQWYFCCKCKTRQKRYCNKKGTKV